MSSPPRISITRASLKVLFDLTQRAKAEGKSSLTFQDVPVPLALAEKTIEQAAAPLGYRIVGGKPPALPRLVSA